MTKEEDEIYLLEHSLLSFEEQYIELTYTWECYKIIYQKYYEKHKKIQSYLEFSINVIAGSLVRTSWSSMMRIWDDKDKNYNNMNICSFYNASTQLKYQKFINEDEKLFISSKKKIRTIYMKNIENIEKIRSIRNNHLSHKNLGNRESILTINDKKRNGNRLDLLHVNHSFEEFDKLYMQTEKLLVLCYELLGRKLNIDNLKRARTASVEGANELIKKIL